MLRNLNKWVLIFAVFALSFTCKAQVGSYWSHRDLQLPIEGYMLGDRDRDHLSIRPLSLDDVPGHLLVTGDSSLVLAKRTMDFWAIPEKKAWHVGVLPLIDVGAGFSSQANGVYRAGTGVATQVRYGKKWSLYADMQGGIERAPAYIQDFVDSLGIVPSLGRNLGNDGQLAFLMPTVRLDFEASEYFTFELGYGRNFFGQGHRSTFLSDVSFNNPYFKFTTDVWHFKYVNVFSALRDVRRDPSDPSTYENKYTATHYLSYAVSPRFNIGLFETIVWQGQDTLSNRGFDPHYLNPIIFYRPVEYSIGSPDNVLIGLDMSLKIGRKNVIYTQLLFDEFLLSAFRERNGWWGNKWSAQLGVKSFDAFAVKGLRLQAEFNLARPFTYTHGSVLQNFGHYNQPLAHILGANFYEGLAFAYYEKDRWYADAQWMYAQYGRDPDSLNLGGNIFRSYVNPARQFDNEIGQGIKNSLFYQTLSIGRVFNPALNLRLAFTYSFRRHEAEGFDTNTEHIFGIRFSTALYNDYRDF